MNLFNQLSGASNVRDSVISLKFAEDQSNAENVQDHMHTKTEMYQIHKLSAATVKETIQLPQYIAPHVK